MKRLGIAALLMLGMGCASLSTQVTPLARDLGVQRLCIQHNPKVQEKELIPLVSKLFAERSIVTEIFYDDRPAYCEFTLAYSARRTFVAFKPRLAWAELRILQGGQQVASAEYQQGKGFVANPTESVESKLTPVITELLAQYPLKQ